MPACGPSKASEGAAIGLKLIGKARETNPPWVLPIITLPYMIRLKHRQIGID